MPRHKIIFRSNRPDEEIESDRYEDAERQTWIDFFNNSKRGQSGKLIQGDRVLRVRAEDVERIERID